MDAQPQLSIFSFFFFFFWARASCMHHWGTQGASYQCPDVGQFIEREQPNSMAWEAVGQGLRHIQDLSMSSPVLTSMPLALWHILVGDCLELWQPSTLSHLLSVWVLLLGIASCLCHSPDLHCLSWAGLTTTLTWDMGPRDGQRNGPRRLSLRR